MVYSTCSLFKEENEETVKAALSETGCVLEPIDPSVFAGATFLPSDMGGSFTVLPDETYEGFFLAKIKKV